MLHDYKQFTASAPSPIRLMPATVDSDAVPKGFGFLRVPAPNIQGFLDVRTFYDTPKLRTTVIDERDLLRAADLNPTVIESEHLTKHYDSGTFTYQAKHKSRNSFDVIIYGILQNGKCYTDILIPPPSDNQNVSEVNILEPALIQACERAVLLQICVTPDADTLHLQDALDACSTDHDSQSVHDYIQHGLSVFALRQETERLLWHQRLGHPSDHYLFNAHKHIDGVPKFKHMDSVLDKCPTCIRAKQTKEPAGPNTTRVATQPYQGLSVDFSFAGMKSKNEERAQDFLGVNGETCWILVTDHFSRMKHGATRVSKASPIAWIKDFLHVHSPDCPNKYVVLDQGGELYRNPDVVRVFEKAQYEVHPTGADSSNQNGPVERGHLTVANHIRAMLVGANLDIQFWPFAFHHWLRIDNSIPSRDQTAAPLMIAQNKRDDFSGFRTFGCRVWVRPPGRRSAKFIPNSIKAIFLGFQPGTTKNIVYFDPEHSTIKLAKHVIFDEGMNDLAPSDVPPNVTHLHRTQYGDEVPAESAVTTVPEFDVGSSPYFHTIVRQVRVQCRFRGEYGFEIATDEDNNRAFVANTKPRSSAAQIFSSHRATNNKIRGAYIVSIAGEPMFTASEVLNALHRLRASKVDSFSIEFAPERRLSARDRRRAAHEHDELFAHLDKVDDNHVPFITVGTIRSIASIRFEDRSSFQPSQLPLPIAQMSLNAIRSAATTPEELALGRFSRRRLKQTPTWDLWAAGERKQLDQFHDLRMYGEPVFPPQDAIVLRQHWQYQIKRDGTRRARNCCDGSPRAAPTLHKFAKTYSSCVEQPIQRMFFALAAHMGYKVYGGDAKDAYAHSPPPERPTFVAIDDAYAEWYFWKFGVHVDRKKVLPVLHALQGHPESGRLWEEHINKILLSPSFGFCSTTHDKSIYRGNFDTTPILMLRQVDDFALACPFEAIAVNVYDRIGKALQLPGESEPPFKYLGLITDFNGVDVHQYNDRIVISVANYIDRILRSHGWETASPNESESGAIPIPADSLTQLYSVTGPLEGSSEHDALTTKSGFSYRTLLGELMFAYITCRLDIGFSVITLSKFSKIPAEFHFTTLKKVVKYLRRTKQWGIHFHRSTSDSSLPSCPFDVLPTDDVTVNFPALEPGPSLTCFLDAAHGNDLRNRRSTTGFAFLLAGGSISYKSKTQTSTATSSTEAEFYAAVSAAKQARYLRAILFELAFPPGRPTPLHCDNQSAIKMINARIPTTRSRHISIQFFAIQDWKDSGDIIMLHIPGILNPSDDLTKPLGWVLHSRHARRLMGHYGVP
eukprot:scaffold13535_cov117-Cylindrotheca_fusiformis.AAC.2